MPAANFALLTLCACARADMSLSIPMTTRVAMPTRENVQVVTEVLIRNLARIAAKTGRPVNVVSKIAYLQSHIMLVRRSTENVISLKQMIDAEGYDQSQKTRALEHAVTILENLSPELKARCFDDSHALARLRNPMNGEADPKYIYLKMEGIQQILSGGYDVISAGNRDVIDEVHFVIIKTLQRMLEQKQGKEAANEERSIVHHDVKDTIAERIVPREGVSPDMHSRAVTMGIYPHLYHAVLNTDSNPNTKKRPREEASAVGVPLSCQAVIQQGTKSLQIDAADFLHKVKTLQMQEENDGNMITFSAAAVIIRDRMIARGQYIKQDRHGNNLNNADQVRMAFDKTFESLGVPTSSVGTRRLTLA